MIWYIIISTIIISLIAFIGILTLGINDKVLNKIIFFLVSMSAGALLGGGFLHLLPEAVEAIDSLNIYLVSIGGFIIFFIIEKVLYYHQCHNVEEEHICEFHTVKWMNLLGDAIHNLIDGLIIAASFLTSIYLGYITTIAVIFHEIPQEIGDFAVLVYGGFSRKKAMFLNFITALIAVIGGIFGYFLISFVDSIKPYLLAVAAGGFLYISAADLVPEIRKERKAKKLIVTILIFLFGIILMWLFKFIFE